MSSFDPVVIAFRQLFGRSINFYYFGHQMSYRRSQTHFSLSFCYRGYFFWLNRRTWVTKPWICNRQDLPTVYENADCEKAMHMLAGHLAGHFDSMTLTFPAPEHNAHTETPHTSFVTTPIAKVIPTAAA